MAQAPDSRGELLRLRYVVLDGSRTCPELKVRIACTLDLQSRASRQSEILRFTPDEGQKQH